MDKTNFNFRKMPSFKKQYYFLLFAISSFGCFAQTGTYQITATAPSPSSFSSLSAAVTGIGTNDATLHINSNITVSANLTVPSNISLKFYKGAVITINSGVILTLKGPLDAGAFQLFNCIGTGIVKGSPKIDQALPEWWKKPADTYWTDAIQKAVDFCPRVFFQKGDYIINGTINLSMDFNHIIYGNGRSTNIISDADQYVFSMISNNSFPTHSSFEDLYFHCKKGIKFNNETTPVIKNNQILNIKITRCIFSHDRGSGTFPDIAINLYEVFDSTVSENLIESFDIGIKLKGCDINYIHDNRVQIFKQYAILDLKDKDNDTTGSQTLIAHNDLLSYQGTAHTGAFIKTTNQYVIIRDNFLENAHSEQFPEVYPLAYIDCSNIGLEETEFVPYNIDITGNRLSTGADFLYLICEDFKSLNLNDAPLAIPLNQIPPSSFCKNSPTKILKRNIPISYEDRPRSINIANVFSFREWRGFNNTNILQNDLNGAMIINPSNISDLAHDPDGHKATFNPKSIQLAKDQYIKIQISQKLSGETGELNGLPKRFKIKLITRNIGSGASATSNNDYYVTIKKDGEDDVDAWAGFGSYVCNNTSDSNYNNYNTYIASPSIDINSTSDYWMLLNPLNSDKELKYIIIEPDESECMEDNETNKPAKESIDLEDNLKVYPNPTDNILKIETGNFSINSILVYDLSGRFIKDYTKEVKDKSINVGALPSGSYIVKIATAGETSKIILKK
ncbi:hypothetical protein GGR22_002182 [Flavobacterium gossypii]|uniref:Secretion system C-terminal sorting domain-containing protein n=1 Tax=Flavobacterium gossypii TaxID=1646119 RepID=A0ABR6DT58_9FLAO|nr:T9SS type A sorting domain-containing protein [Flavobacterium gossypii]MBA9074015.1 hypothetical protein [Flavobacterium gossypii]